MLLIKKSHKTVVSSKKWFVKKKYRMALSHTGIDR